MRRKEIGITEHAVLYAVLAKALFQHVGNTEHLLKEITEAYGYRRGKRMRANAERLGLGNGISAYFRCGEWRGLPDENRSVLTQGEHRAESLVEVCGWYETWKKYGLLEYGTCYCRWIDRAIVRGFSEQVMLAIPESKGRGDENCRFVFTEADERETSETDADEPISMILPFSFHCQELYTTAEEILKERIPAQAELILTAAEQEYRKITGEEYLSFLNRENEGI
ncbi:MAG: L-2-amino-thiazoline-4-carboxylic acid hydrolase [Solobacterium sp.]|nr:L-2-amino-thiazoline-4-carboxylic acid hydrolase [Solobacterium sp.]